MNKKNQDAESVRVDADVSHEKWLNKVEELTNYWLKSEEERAKLKDYEEAMRCRDFRIALQQLKVSVLSG